MNAWRGTDLEGQSHKSFCSVLLKRGFAMNTKTETVETKEVLKGYREAWNAAILAIQCPSQKDVLIYHALGVAL